MDKRTINLYVYLTLRNRFSCSFCCVVVFLSLCNVLFCKLICRFVFVSFAYIVKNHYFLCISFRSCSGSFEVVAYLIRGR